MPEPTITIENIIYYTSQASEAGIHLIYAGHVVYLPHGSIERHTHGHYEICLFTQGTVEVTVGDQIYTLSAGDLLLTKPGDLHSINSMGNAWGKLYIGVDKILADDLENIFRYCDQRVFRESQSLGWIFRELIAEIKDHKFGMSATIESLLTVLLVDIARLIHPERRSDEKSTPEPVGLARIYIDTHPFHDLDLSAVAEYSSLSRSRLSCVFARETGMTLRNYLKHVIMHRALRLLEDDRKSISEIADEFRYPSVQYFSTVFRRFWGYTPRDYRTSVRKQVPYRHQIIG
ncbi:MAG TPA: AraC family transcriptional regulator [Armatimonadota bacterium]|jgi:AraC-like DNA-binding protein